jgi:LCP family protein required for cell wall assembly
VNRHLNDRQLLSYLENDLSPGRRERADAHLRACSTCQARLQRTAQTAADLAMTLQAVGEQVPLSPAHSWNTIVQRRQREQPRRYVAFFPFLRYAAILAVLVLIVGGLAGLIHTLAVTGPALPQAEPTPTPLPTSPSPAPGPLPHAQADRMAAPVSLLVLGVDGERATSDETDMLMLLYLDAKAERAFLLSIPRDLYVEVPGYGQARAGSVYGLGEQDTSTNGLALARQTISATLGLAVDHAAMVRFDSFVTIVDTIGGVDVEVPHPIDDPDFPDGQGGSDPFSLPAGTQHLDGTTALRYARTRVVPADDFDRTFRQQQLALAVHDRVTRLDLLPDLIAQAPTIWSAVAGGLETDLSLSNVIDLALPATSLTTADVATTALNECCTVASTTSAGRRVLLPQPEEIEALIQNLLEKEQ